MTQTTFAGSHYPTIAAAARAWAETALPDVRVIAADEPSDLAAAELEAFWWGETLEIGDGAPGGIDANAWRDECRASLRARIDRSRPRCVAPVEGAKLCGATATTERTCEGLVCAMCAPHAAEYDADTTN